jgi:hypothetical protein
MYKTVTARKEQNGLSIRTKTAVYRDLYRTRYEREISLSVEDEDDIAVLHGETAVDKNSMIVSGYWQ